MDSVTISGNRKSADSMETAIEWPEIVWKFYLGTITQNLLIKVCLHLRNSSSFFVAVFRL